jgi:methionyl-tRNA formyltransferase
MKKISSPIIFFGSGPVAAQALNLLLQDFEIEAVVSKASHTQHNDSTPVLKVATAAALQVFTPDNKTALTELFVHNQPKFKSAVGLVIDYGIIIEQQVIDFFPHGIVNSHFSLLPQWRGADPISFSILSGQPRTGVSLMVIDKHLDEGPIIAQASYDIKSHETTPTLTNELITLSHKLIVSSLPDYLSGKIVPKPQDIGAGISYSRKLTKQDSVIDWTKPAIQIEREIRAFIEWPKSITVLADKNVIITEARVVDRSGKPGKVVVDGSQLLVCCGQQALQLLRLKPAGKNEMSAEAFLAGYAARLLVGGTSTDELS